MKLYLIQGAGKIFATIHSTVEWFCWKNTPTADLI